MKFSTLTKKQQEILDIVTAHIHVNGESPSLRDIQKKATKVSSFRGITLQLDVLEKAGYITRKSTAKSITLNNILAPSYDEFIKIPLLIGQARAGIPSLFEEYIDKHITVKLSTTKGLKKVFAIKINGDSMIDMGINDGDYAIITPSVVAKDGDTIIALFNDGLTIKKLRYLDGYPLLLSANKEKKYPPISMNFEIKGRLVNILKQEMLDLYQEIQSLSSNHFNGN